MVSYGVVVPVVIDAGAHVAVVLLSLPLSLLFCRFAMPFYLISGHFLLETLRVTPPQGQPRHSSALIMQSLQRPCTSLLSAEISVSTLASIENRYLAR